MTAAPVHVLAISWRRSATVSHRKVIGCATYFSPKMSTHCNVASVTVVVVMDVDVSVVVDTVVDDAVVVVPVTDVVVAVVLAAAVVVVVAAAAVVVVFSSAAAAMHVPAAACKT